MIGVEIVDPLGGGSLLGPEPQVIGHMDAADHQDSAILLDLTDRVRAEEPVAGWYLTRFQRAPEGSRQSASGRGDDVVEGRRMRLVDVGVDPIVLRDLGVRSEQDRLRLDR